LGGVAEVELVGLEKIECLKMVHYKLVPVVRKFLRIFLSLLSRNMKVGKMSRWKSVVKRR